LTVGDVYRKDEIDSCHHRVFHQMEGVAPVPNSCDCPKEELKRILGGLVEHLFPKCEYRFNKDYFPFTTDSIEVEVFYNDKWMEILGGGILQPKIIESSLGDVETNFWAFGMGLERLAMILFSIPDIRYFWSDHPKFLTQFSSGSIDITFEPYSRLPNISNDISFFIDNDYMCKEPNETGEIVERWIEDNEFYEIVRDVGDNWVQNVSLMDSFFHKKKNLHSRTFTITYSPHDPSLKDPSEFRELINSIQTKLRESVKYKLHLTLR
jgi:phenylalanyl-tRNA synthetase alpha chain